MSVEIVSNRINVEKATEKALEKAATMIGGSLAGHASEGCPVDTGLLRNSITYALGGKSANTQTYASTQKDAEGNTQTGTYEGEAPRDQAGEITVYIGTNVQYAPYVELGHSQEPGRYVPAIGKRLKADHVDARPFLRPACENNRDEIEKIIEKCLKEIR